MNDGLRNRLGANNQEDGEFYVSFEEFLKYFDTLDIVHVNLNAMYSPSKNNSNLKWNVKQWHGEWKAGINSGKNYLKLLPNLLNVIHKMGICLTQRYCSNSKK